MSSSGPASAAVGSVSMPSASAARATAIASMRSDLPRSRLERREPAINRVETRTTRSPRAIRNRSKRARHVPAVLQRPHPLAVQAARPDQQRAEPARADRGGLLTEHLAGRRRDGGDRVRALVHVRTEHDHDPRPVLSISDDETARRTRLAGGAATLLSSHAGHPRPATSDTTKGSQTRPGPTASKRVSSPPGRDLLPGVGRHRRAESQQQASKRHSGEPLPPTSGIAVYGR